MHDVFIMSPVCRAALEAGDTIEEFERVFAKKFGTVTDDETAFFEGQYTLFNNRVLAMIDFMGMTDETFLFELADTMNQMPDAVIHRQISPYFNFTADLHENSCVLRRNKCRPIFETWRKHCDHSWCIKFADIETAMTQATRMGQTRVVRVKTLDFSYEYSGLHDVNVTVHPTIYTKDQILAASPLDLVEMRVRNRTQVLMTKVNDRDKSTDIYRMLEDTYESSYHPPRYRMYPRDVILDVEPISHIGTCECVARRGIDKMSPTEYRDHMINLPIQTFRTFMHYDGKPVDKDHAIRIAMPFIEKSGLTRYLALDKCHRTDEIQPRVRRIQLLVTDTKVTLIRKHPECGQVGPGRYDRSDFLFDVPVVHELPSIACICDNPHNPRLFDPSLEMHDDYFAEMYFWDRAVDIGMNPNRLGDLDEECPYWHCFEEPVISLTREQLQLSMEYVEFKKTKAERAERDRAERARAAPTSSGWLPPGFMASAPATSLESARASSGMF